MATRLDVCTTVVAAALELFAAVRVVGVEQAKGAPGFGRRVRPRRGERHVRGEQEEEQGEEAERQPVLAHVPREISHGRFSSPTVEVRPASCELGRRRA